MEKTSKTTVFNLVILDESGSMSSLKKMTIDGCNETLNVVRKLQKENSDTQRCLVSIYAFQGDGSLPSRYICKNVPADKVKDVTPADYQPEGMTPLLDAVGSTLVDLKAIASTHEDATASVTIITDGYENASREYTYQDVSRLISQLKELGWNFNFIGANIDVDKVSKQLNVDNVMSFDANEKGTKKMWHNYNDSLMTYHSSRIELEKNCCCEEDVVETRKRASKSFFRK